MNMRKEKKKKKRRSGISAACDYCRVQSEILPDALHKSLKKGKGSTQVIYLKMSVSDNDVILSSTSCPASLWDEGMSRTTPDTRL